MKSRKVALIIMDGWGHGQYPDVSAISKAKTPYIDDIYKTYPNSELLTHGEFVGLPKGQMGNSEVGHMNLGAGRIVYQDLLKINRDIDDNGFYKNKTFLDAFAYAKKENVNVHLMGLVSEGGVHSSMKHLFALCKMCKDQNIKKAFIHCFTDGRDTDPKSGLDYIKKLNKEIEGSNIKLGSIIGRYYAMDRDKRWERIQLAYDLLINGSGEKFNDPVSSIKQSYANEITDEFIKPISINSSSRIQDKDVVICFNFRTDRCREITQVLTQEDNHEYGMKTKDLYYVTMTEYDKTFKNIKVAFSKKNLINTLGEVIQDVDKKQLRASETEKYPHVTFFFSGGRESLLKGEKRILIDSPKVNTYDLKPEMSAYQLKDTVIQFINNEENDFICLNFANADMVGHTGVFDAAVKACEAVDQCVKEVVEHALKNDYAIILTADHGNSDFMINEDGSPNTAHTTNPVPWFLIDKEFKPKLKKGKLADIAPTILKLMDIPIPDEMNGQILWDI